MTSHLMAHLVQPLMNTTLHSTPGSIVTPLFHLVKTSFHIYSSQSFHYNSANLLCLLHCQEANQSNSLLIQSSISLQIILTHPILLSFTRDISSCIHHIEDQSYPIVLPNPEPGCGAPLTCMVHSVWLNLGTSLTQNSPPLVIRQLSLPEIPLCSSAEVQLVNARGYWNVLDVKLINFYLVLHKTEI